MAAAALVLYLLVLAIAFGWRSVVQWRRTGDTGLRLDAGPPRSVTWWAKLLFIAALLVGLAGPIAGISGLPPIARLDHFGFKLGGAVLAVTGVLATLAAQTQMGTSWRVGVDPDEHTTLVTGGAFALARNPIFTTMIVTSLGLAFMVPNAVSLVATLLLVVAIQLQVRSVEEPYLTRIHGTIYAAYTARVGRFLPGIGTRSHLRRPRSSSAPDRSADG